MFCFDLLLGTLTQCYCCCWETLGMKGGFHIAQEVLDMLSLVLLTFPCHLIQMPSPNPQAYKKHIPFTLFLFPCTKVYLMFCCSSFAFH